MIYVIRGQKVMLDSDLAALWVKQRLNEQVRRNLDRFPEDFMFQLDSEEYDFEVANCDFKSKGKTEATSCFY